MTGEVSSDQIVDCARRWIGTPYRHQASRCGVGADCLGLVRGVYRDLYAQEFRMTPGAAAKHAAIRSFEGRMIHACSGRAVAEVHMGAWWPRHLAFAFRFPGARN